ncbi:MULTISPECIES: hypothetical protein [unclassified Haladaptatus]|uniref:hypothetical protein n=1 Tax=unclassified Haladaptatus TaxID=2622732 RepID=UPI000AEAC8A6|nr:MULTISPECIES: hypothetical protein [unclassified Haladaptatus]MCO8245762.1 hypothetical protein [Haladaptatus sp. AB643]MCO8256108.1 hypothetical protein [Haladaptatus sp. AB618]
MMIGVFLFAELFITVVFLSVAAGILYQCHTADEWEPRGLVDMERDAGIDEEWR